MFEEATLADLQHHLASGRVTARALAEWYLDRIATLDQAGPRLNAVIQVNPEALDIAGALDDERRARGPRGPLHGVPVLLKDNLDTADQMLTTAGSLALAGHVAAEDAGVVQRLRAAGAVILGKTNLSEWANFRGQRSSSGWSSRGGQTRNPYALDRNPSGSSSGSGVAVSANLCAAAIGTETDGSIVSPAHANGIVGLKPTVGLVSRAGIIPIAHSQDTAGPMTRTVADAAMLLGVLAGPDPRDPATASAAAYAHSDYTQFLDANGLRGARLGVARSFAGFNMHVDRVFEAALDAMRRLGAELIDVELRETPEMGQNEMTVLLYEFKADLNAYLARVGPHVAVHSLADVIAFNESHREQVLPYFGHEHMVAAEAKGSLDSEEYRRALADNHRLTRAEGIDAALAQHQLHALVAPTGGPAWPTDWANGDHYAGGSSSPAAVAGYPNITVPAGQVFGLPVGVSFFASAYQEPTLLRLAYAFEQGVGARQPPRYLPTAEFTPAAI